MPASPPPFNSDSHRGSSFRRDEAAVSEVIGYVLTFAIISGVLVLSMLTFNVARERTADRVLEVEAASVAHRVAAAVVEAGLFVERQTAAGATPTDLHLVLDLPESFQGTGYTIALCQLLNCPPAPCTTPTVVVVTVGAFTVIEPLLGVEADCVTRAGGPLAVSLSGSSSSLSLVNP